MTGNAVKTRKIHRMPYGFGPTPGPRQGPNGDAVDGAHTAQKFTVATGFLTKAEHLARLLPPGFVLAGEPVVTVEFHVLSGLNWLAGRGYSMLQVRFPAKFQGVADEVTGSFLPVLWENLADPILSGREELGFAKLWCDLPPPRIYQNRISCIASWLSHQFFELEVCDLQDADNEVPVYPGLGVGKSQGTLHYKYIPDTQNWGSAALAHACLSPSGTQVHVERLRLGHGRVRFLETNWEQMPTQFHIVSALAALPQLERRGAWVLETSGGSDLAEQRKLS